MKVLLTMNYLKLLSLKCSKTCFIKKEITYANYALYITKALSKAIMHRFELKTKYVKTKTQTKLKLCKKHKNFYSKLYKMERRKSYESLDMTLREKYPNTEFFLVLIFLYSD